MSPSTDKPSCWLCGSFDVHVAFREYRRAYCLKGCTEEHEHHEDVPAHDLRGFVQDCLPPPNKCGERQINVEHPDPLSALSWSSRCRSFAFSSGSLFGFRLFGFRSSEIFSFGGTQKRLNVTACETLETVPLAVGDSNPKTR